MKLQKLLKGRSPEIGSIDNGRYDKNALPAMMLNSDGRNPAATSIRSSSSSSLAAASSVKSTSSNDKILQPNQYDVLFGRGKPFQSHEGNIRLHKIVDGYKPRYSQARRHEKTEIAEQIVQSIKNNKEKAGRFLKRADDDDDKGTGEEYWVQVSDSIARDKVSHALRGKPHNCHHRKEEKNTKKERKSPATPIPKRRTAKTASSPCKSKKRLLKQMQAQRTSADVVTVPVQQQNKRQKTTMLPELFSSIGRITSNELELLNAARLRSSPPTAAGAASTTIFSSSQAPNFGYSKAAPSLDLLRSQLLASSALAAAGNSNILLRRLSNNNNTMMMFNQNTPSQLGSLQSMLGQQQQPSLMIRRNIAGQMMSSVGSSLLPPSNDTLRMMDLVRSSPEQKHHSIFLLGGQQHISPWSK